MNTVLSMLSKVAQIATAAVIAGALLIGGTAFADVAALKTEYVDGAFSGADTNWRRLMANRYSECGTFGTQDDRRIDVLISKYEAIGDALNSGSEGAAADAAHSFAATLGESKYFASCWNSISRKNGVSRGFVTAAENA